MAYITPEVDDIYLSPDDFFEEMSEREKEEMYDILVENGYGESFIDYYQHQPSNIIEWEFDAIIKKIASNRLRLTSEEEEILQKIASRF